MCARSHKGKPMRPTINMIAKLADVSRGTVDRVINGRQYVSEDKRERVLKIMRDLRYTPNMAARALVKSKTLHRIGILYPGWSGYFEKELLRGITAGGDAFKDFGIELAVHRCESIRAEDFATGIDRLMERDVEALALFAVDSMPVRARINAIASRSIPVVTFNSDIADSERLCFVGQDRVLGGKLAAGLFARMRITDRGVIVGLGNTAFTAHKDRVDGFLGQWAALGHDVDKCEIVETLNDYDTTYEKIRAVLAARPDMSGIYMANESTLACVQAVREAGLKSPPPIIGHDLSDSNRDLLRAGEVDFVIDQDIFLQGYRPVELLAEAILYGRRPEKQFEASQSIIYTAESLI